MKSLAESTSPTLATLAAFDELRSSVLDCKVVAQSSDIRLALQDAHDVLTRIQSECSGAMAAVPLSAVEALGRFKERASAIEGAVFSQECAIAAGRARRVLARVSGGEPRLSITSETYLRRLSQLLTALARLSQ